jgi:hypothetical protein
MSYLIPSMIFEEYSKHLDRETYEKLFKSDDFEKLLSLYPAFGADIVQALQTKSKLCMGHLCKAWCEVCKEDSVIDVAHMRKQGYTNFCCSFCAHPDEISMVEWVHGLEEE